MLYIISYVYDIDNFLKACVNNELVLTGYAKHLFKKCLWRSNLRVYDSIRVSEKFHWLCKSTDPISRQAVNK